MNALRGWTAPLLTIFIGGIAALGVALVSFRLGEQERQVEELGLQARLELVAALVASQVPPQGSAAPDAAAQEAQALTLLLEKSRQRSGVERIFVVDASQHLRANSSSAPVGGTVAPWSPRPVLDLCAVGVSSGQGIVLTSLFDGGGGRLFRAACAPLSQEGGAAAGTVGVIASADYVARAAETEFNTRAMVVGVGAIVGLLVMLGIMRLMSPIQMVSEAAERMAAGERGVRVPTEGPAEIQQLSTALNALGSAVEAREDEIRSRLATVTQISGIVAHEVRNPLQSLSLLCTLARTESDPSERDSLLASIEAEIHVLEGVVQRFLRSSGPLQISRVPVDLHELVTRAMNVARPQAAARQVEIELHAPPRLPMVIDGSLVRRAVENLLLNAIEFSGQDPPGRVTASVLRRGREAIVMVDDDGPGVPAGDRDRIFQAYYSSKSGGTGLGLALVKQVFEAHGGGIRCEASPLGGARFIATLPIDESLEVPFAR